MKRVINLIKRMSRLESAVLYLFLISLVAWIADSLIKSSITSDILTISLAALLIASVALFIYSLKVLLKKRAAVKAKKRKQNSKRR